MGPESSQISRGSPGVGSNAGVPAGKPYLTPPVASVESWARRTCPDFTRTVSAGSADASLARSLLVFSGDVSPSLEFTLMAKDLVAYGIYPDRVSFENALEGLREAGFRSSDVSVILPDRDHTAKDLAHEINSKAPEGFSTGAGAGAAVGGVLGWLIGIGALAIP